MEIKFLGTGTSQGIPVIACDCPVCKSSDGKDKRLRTSILISRGNKNYLIDVGPDFRQQMLTHGITTIESVWITHEHNDHMIGLDDLRPFIFRMKKKMRLYGLKRVLDEIKSRFQYAFEYNPYPGAPSFELQVVHPDENERIDDFEMIPIRVEHGPLPILGFRIGDFAYLTDVKTILPNEMKKLEGLDTLVISALRRREHHSHMSLDEALSMIEALGPKQAYLTHLSHKMGLHRDVTTELPTNVHLAFDGLTLKTN